MQDATALLSWNYNAKYIIKEIQATHMVENIGHFVKR